MVIISGMCHDQLLIDCCFLLTVFCCCCCFLVLHCCKHMRLSCALNHLLTYLPKTAFIRVSIHFWHRNNALRNKKTYLRLNKYNAFTSIGPHRTYYASRLIFTARRVCIARTMPWQDICLSVCLSVRPSVPQSVTRRYCV